MANRTLLTDGVVLFSSPDGGAWYLQRPSDDKTSQPFPSANAARAALLAINGPTPPLQPLIEWS